MAIFIYRLPLPRVPLRLFPFLVPRNEEISIRSLYRSRFCKQYKNKYYIFDQMEQTSQNQIWWRCRALRFRWISKQWLIGTSDCSTSLNYFQCQQDKKLKQCSCSCLLERSWINSHHGFSWKNVKTKKRYWQQKKINL